MRLPGHLQWAVFGAEENSDVIRTYNSEEAAKASIQPGEDGLVVKGRFLIDCHFTTYLRELAGEVWHACHMSINETFDTFWQQLMEEK